MKPDLVDEVDRLLEPTSLPFSDGDIPDEQEAAKAARWKADVRQLLAALAPPAVFAANEIEAQDTVHNARILDLWGLLETVVASITNSNPIELLARVRASAGLSPEDDASAREALDCLRASLVERYEDDGVGVLDETQIATLSLRLAAAGFLPEGDQGDVPSRAAPLDPDAAADQLSQLLEKPGAFPESLHSVVRTLVDAVRTDLDQLPTEEAVSPPASSAVGMRREDTTTGHASRQNVGSPISFQPPAETSKGRISSFFEFFGALGLMFGLLLVGGLWGVIADAIHLTTWLYIAFAAMVLFSLLEGIGRGRRR